MSQRALRDLLVSMFSTSELNMLVSFEFSELTNEIDWKGSPNEVALAFVRAMNARGRIDDAMFGVLVKERPGREADIQNVRQQFGKPPPPPPAPVQPEIPAPPEQWWEKIPPDLSHDTAREALGVLIHAYPNVEKIRGITAAAGIQEGYLNLSGAAFEIWPRVLTTAGSMGKMTLLIKRIFEDPRIVAYRPKLQAGFPSQTLTDELWMGSTEALVERVKQGGAESIGISLGPEGVPQVGMQAIVNAGAGLPDPLAYIGGLVTAMRRTAMLEIGGSPKGTGFLVGPRHILTNAHVVGALGADLPDVQVVATFDFYAGGLASHAQTGRRVLGRPVLHSPPTSKEISELDTSDAVLSNLDFCLIELDDEVGLQPGGPSELVASGGSNRGFYSPSTLVYDYAKAGLLLIVQHPLGERMSMSYTAGPGKLISNEGRVQYRANTLNGSSGSAVVDSRGRLVALHHFGGTSKNQGVPIWLIAERLKAFEPSLTVDT